MKHYIHDNAATLVFEKGEPFIATLTDFCKEQQITAGFFHGLGGALSAELGYYHLDRQEYVFRKLDLVLEVVSLHGNITLKDDEPFIHAHGVLSDAAFTTYGGHIKELIVGGTLEVHFDSFGAKWRRVPDNETGLSLIEFDADSDQ